MIEIRNSDADSAYMVDGENPYGVEYPFADAQNGDYVESFAAGAFARSAAHDTVELRVQHDQAGAPLAATGRSGTMVLRDTPSGLQVHARLAKDDPQVQSAVSKVRAGLLDRLSVGFSNAVSDWSDNHSRRVIRSARLHEISLVHQPANPGAIVTGVRADRTVTDFEMRTFAPVTYVEQRGGPYTAAQVEELGRSGLAYRNPDGHFSYPIADREDLLRAIHAIGRSGLADKSGLRRFIISRTKALNAARLIPANWNADGTTSRAAVRDNEFLLELRRLQAAGPISMARARPRDRLSPVEAELRLRAMIAEQRALDLCRRR